VYSSPSPLTGDGVGHEVAVAWRVQQRDRRAPCVQVGLRPGVVGATRVIQVGGGTWGGYTMGEWSGTEEGHTQGCRVGTPAEEAQEGGTYVQGVLCAV